MKLISRIALMLVIIGALNWGLVGLFRLDLVAGLLGGMNTVVSRIIYSLIGISAAYIVYESLSGKN